jgi:hypothetical protein
MAKREHYAKPFTCIVATKINVKNTFSTEECVETFCNRMRNNKKWQKGTLCKTITCKCKLTVKEKLFQRKII